ncbi:hypothetical protein DB44_CW00570 [Candidatus Protochlamydia amoebophila]|uniref:Transposase n=1 Tax=Candidatus Protochlamydia amoebophila TaxID=362787 RepID=A0A0C1H2K6_9BACT|nr:hypothetical protein DB44_CW00570 [Candidatus Protochlamydia amoebophila]
MNSLCLASLALGINDPKICHYSSKLGAFVGNKKNDHWLWLVLHKKSRQVLARQVSLRDKKNSSASFCKTT